ncbi:hypothetical protein A3762_02745 [Oleiphilus sp. HI0125]|nr:hypothetical protein A3762_02745 [Oleiphilus sp. HI0125]
MVALLSESCRHNMLIAVFLAMTLCLTALSFSASAASQEESEEKLEQLKSNISTITNWLNKANKNKSSLIQQLKEQEKTISRTNLKISKNKTEINSLLKELDALKIDIKKQKQNIKAQQGFIIEELQALYLEGRQPKLKALLDQDDPQSSARFLAYFDYLQDARSATINQYEKDVQALEESQALVLRKQTLLNTNRKTLEKQLAELKDQTNRRNVTLSQLNKEIKTKSGELTSLKESQKQLEELLVQVEKSISELKLPEASTPFIKQKSKLPWPSRGRVLERFGARLAQGKLRSNGIRIQAKEDAGVKAVHYGRVVFSDWLRGFGLLIILDHGDNYLSLYGNNKSLHRSVGDWVNPGEVIAHAGNSGGRERPSLYFEIRKNGKPQDPRKWLSK